MNLFTKQVERRRAAKNSHTNAPKEATQMPKIIHNAKAILIDEAKRQLEENGYSAMTMRSVASACGFAVGTIYNYFDSKEVLVGSFVVEDWKNHLDEMAALPIGDSKILLGGIYASLSSFIKKHEKLFSDPDAAKIIHHDFTSKHRILRDQIAKFILPLCEEKQLEKPDAISRFLSEAIISMAIDKADFETVYPVLEKLIK